MPLVSGYSSESSSESDNPVNTVEDLSSVHSYKRIKLTNAQKRAQRLKRKSKGPWGAWSSDDITDSNEELRHVTVKDYETLGNEREDDEDAEDTATSLEKSTFYGPSIKDYQGRSYLHPSIDIDTDLAKTPMSFKCYLPKRLQYTYNGHHGGTTSLKFFPQTGHLFLSGGNDNTLKLWDFYHERKCLQDYRGHSKAIKSVSFNEDGSVFASSSFDGNVKLWNTETGKVEFKLHLNCIPNDTQFRPSSPDEFIVGCSDSKIYHYDTRVASKNGRVQKYDHHLGGILSLQFFPDGSKFISSSEDKTIRIWENQINVPIKQISGTSQHSMPYIALHPAHKYFCGQSMDNTIYSYSMKPKYKKHPKKAFKGHSSSGYNIGLSFSPDGKYICSGDSTSQLVIWDWNTTRLLKKFTIPGNQPVTQVAWSPQETSKILCTGVAGKIYIMD